MTGRHIYQEKHQERRHKQEDHQSENVGRVTSILDVNNQKFKYSNEAKTMTRTTPRLPPSTATGHMDGCVGFPPGISSKPLYVPKPPFQGCLGDYHTVQYDYHNKTWVAVGPYAYYDASSFCWICCGPPVQNDSDDSVDDLDSYMEHDNGKQDDASMNNHQFGFAKTARLKPNRLGLATVLDSALADNGDSTPPNKWDTKNKETTKQRYTRLCHEKDLDALRAEITKKPLETLGEELGILYTDDEGVHIQNNLQYNEVWQALRILSAGEIQKNPNLARKIIADMKEGYNKKFQPHLYCMTILKRKQISLTEKNIPRFSITGNLAEMKEKLELIFLYIPTPKCDNLDNEQNSDNDDSVCTG